MTAIARPELFINMLSVLNVQLTRRLTFRDHHLFTKEDWDAAREAGCGVVYCTAKDAVKLRRYLTAEGEVRVLTLGVQFTSDNEEHAFWSMILTVLR